MAQTPDVSVIIAAYEAAEFIGNAIKSALAQENISLEVIVIDDGSKVSCEQAVLAAAAGDPRVIFIQLEKNLGPSGARNAGLAAAKGKYIAILDADDAILPDRLSVLIAAARQHGADIVADNMHATDNLSDESAYYSFLHAERLSDPETITLDTYIDPESDKEFGRPLGYLKPIFSRSFLEKRSLKYDLSLTNSEDFYLVAEALAEGAKMLLIPYTGYIYLVRKGSISHRLNPHQTAAILKAEQDFQDRYLPTMNGAGKSSAERRMQKMQSVHEFETLVATLRQKAPLAFLKALGSNPLSAPRHLSALAAIAVRKL